MRTALLHLLFYALRLLRPRSRPGPRTFLVLQYRTPLGCLVHATPVYAALKAAHPACTVIVATSGLGVDVLAHDPHIDHLIDTGDPGSSLLFVLRHALWLCRELRQRKLAPTLVLIDATNRRGSIALLGLLLRVAPLRGFSDVPPLLDQPLVYDSAQSLLANNLRLVSETTPHIEPAVHFTHADLRAVRHLLQQANPQGKPVTAFAVQGSGGQPNSWHDQHFAAVIRHVESSGHAVIYLGTSAEATAIDRIRSVAQSAGASLAGRTSVPQLAALLCLCDRLITVDTGTMHVARAAGVPMVVLAPSWQPAIEWLPLVLPQAIVLRGPDTDRACIPADYRMDEITVDSVIAALTALERFSPRSEEAREQRIARLLSTTRL